MLFYYFINIVFLIIKKEHYIFLNRKHLITNYMIIIMCLLIYNYLLYFIPNFIFLFTIKSLIIFL